MLVISNYSGAINPVRPEAEIFLGLKKQGVSITVMTPRESYYADRFIEAGIEVIDYHPTKKFDFRAIKLIRKLVRQRGINIVHAFNSRAIANAAWALLGMKTTLVGYRGYSGNIYWYDPSCYLAFLNPRVNYMICLAESVREMFLENGMPAHKAVTISKGHDPAWYNSIEAADLGEFHLPAGAMVCAFVANNRTKMKGLNYLIEATHFLPPTAPVYFLLIGQGLDNPEILRQIAASPYKDRIVFAGFRKNASELIKACDVAISASIYGEATQKAMIEAMYLGKPVVMTDISGNRGMAEDGISGFVVPPRDARAIARAVTALWQDPELRLTMGAKARRRIAEVLNLEKTIADYKAFYERIV